VSADKAWIVEYLIIANGGQEYWYDQRFVLPIYEQELSVAIDIVNRLKNVIKVVVDMAGVRQIRIRNTITHQILPGDLL
jgi:hypothetical protein